MNKVIVSVSAALVLLGALYLLFEENVIRTGYDVIGRSIESEYIEKTGKITLRFTHQLSIELKKIDYLLDTIDAGDLIKNREQSGAASALLDFLTDSPYLVKIRLINRDREIQYSTSSRDVLGAKLDSETYFDLFKIGFSDESPVIADSLIQNLVVFKQLNPQYSLLFYYTRELLDSVFKKIESLEYDNFIMTADKLVLVNFPEIEESDEQNLAELAGTIFNNESGAVRVQLMEEDKTVYYLRGYEPFTDWSIGLTVDTERIRLSVVGALILVIQAAVILAVVIFIVATFKQRKATRASRLKTVKPEEETAAAEEAVEVGEPSDTSVQDVGDKEIDKVPTLEAGVISLNDIEEVMEFEEVGEAEVAEELEEPDKTGKKEIEELEELEEVNDSNHSSTGPVSGEEPELNAGLEPAENIDRGMVPDEPIIDDLKEIESQTGRDSESLPDLESLVKTDVVSPSRTAVKDRFDTEGEGIPGSVETDELQDVFKNFITHLGLSRGAVLLKKGDGIFRPVVMSGLSSDTEGRLLFNGSEKFLQNVLLKDKILYIRNDAFVSGELRGKFNIFDASTIKSMFFAPIFSKGVGLSKGDLQGIILVCLTTGEINDLKTILKELKRIKELISNII